MTLTSADCDRALQGVVERRFPAYAFLRGDDGRQYFVLPSACSDATGYATLREGQRVAFNVLAHPRGLRATSLVLVTESSHA